MVQKLAILCAAIVIAAIACASIWPAFDNPVTWTPDALYYQARMLEIRGADHDAAMSTTFDGALSAELRARDPQKTGNPAWVAYNEPFYARRLAIPLAGAALYPLEGDRSLLDISLAGYVAALLALFALLLMRFRLAIAAAVTLVTVFLPPLVDHASFPLTDSWGLALETSAFAAAILTLDRGRRWLPLWICAVLLLAFTRDSTWIPILAAGWCAWRLRSRDALWLFATGVAAALPALLLFRAPVRSLLALLVNDSEVPSDTSWSFIASHYPRAALELIHANGGFVRDGAWYAALYLVGGVLLLLIFALRGRYRQQHDDAVDERRRRAFSAVCLRGTRVQRVPTRARLRADGGVRDRPRDAGRVGAAIRDRASRRAAGRAGSSAPGILATRIGPGVAWSDLRGRCAGNAGTG